MSIMSWNCRGLGGSSTVRELKRLVRTQNPSILFLCETKIKNKKFEKVRMELQMFGVSVEANGRKGGLALLWRKEVDVRVQGYSANFIDAVVRGIEETWRLTGVYGHSEVHIRHNTWSMIRSLAAGNTLPWICLGDFNEVLHQWECRVGRARPASQMRTFRQMVNDLGLIDLISHGYPYTWARNWKKAGSYRAKLDIALVNFQFRNIWKDARTFHSDTNQSDHLPVIVRLEKSFAGRFNIVKKRNPKRFRFESMWITVPQVNDLIKTTWESSPSEVTGKLESCRHELLIWKKNFGNVFHEADKLRERIAELKFQDKEEEADELEIARLQEDLEKRLDQQEKLWQQRSRVLWLKEGDKNTAYFHSVASRRRKSNCITGLKNEAGIWVEAQKDIQCIIMNYFSNIFTAGQQDDKLAQSLIERIPGKISEAESDFLLQEFTTKDVRQALFDMHPLKAPGPDGFNPQFFQHFWNTVEPELTSSVLQMIKEAVIPQEAGKQGPCISHLMFADDTILFGEATVEEAKVFAKILRIYCEASGQVVNKQKSGQSKSQIFANIKERVISKLQGWEEKLLSKVGMKILWMLPYMQMLHGHGRASYGLEILLRKVFSGALGTEKGVEMLIDAETGVWREDLLMLFNPSDATLIRQIPLGSLEEIFSRCFNFKRWPKQCRQAIVEETMGSRNCAKGEIFLLEANSESNPLL